MGDGTGVGDDDFWALSYIQENNVCMKNIILDTPEQCLSANSIRKKRKHLVPESVYSNQIHIKYLENNKNNKNNQLNVVQTKTGTYSLCFNT
jgi:hypothetical protein